MTIVNVLLAIKAVTLQKSDSCFTWKSVHVDTLGWQANPHVPAHKKKHLFDKISASEEGKISQPKNQKHTQ